jgi:hypothetical protein
MLAMFIPSMFIFPTFMFMPPTQATLGIILVVAFPLATGEGFGDNGVGGGRLVVRLVLGFELGRDFAAPGGLLVAEYD